MVVCAHVCFSFLFGLIKENSHTSICCTSLRQSVVWESPRQLGRAWDGRGGGGAEEEGGGVTVVRLKTLQ